MTPDHALADQARHIADQLLQQIPDPTAAVVLATEDGFDLAHAQAARAQVEAGRMAAMTSSIAAIGDVVGRETGLGRSECLIVETEGGYVVMRSGRLGTTRVVLTALASRRTVLGLLVHAVSATVRERLS